MPLLLPVGAVDLSLQDAAEGVPCGAELLTVGAEEVSFASEWGTEFAPQLVKRNCDGKLIVDS